MLVPFNNPINVTQPLLPDLIDIDQMIKKIWESKQLSNNGEMVKQLESKLSEYLDADYLSVFSNGTAALQIACKLLRLSGEVITTPFTFVATINSLTWNNTTPVFCDIEEDTLNINPDIIESLITEKTTGIMPVHVFGNPCNVDKIQQIADKYGLKVLYDAAHAFGVNYNGKPISSFGDITAFSFHATKIFNTIEGGALVFNNPFLKARADYMRNFGLLNNADVIEPGINAKLNEVQASVGILLLKKVDEEIKRRSEIMSIYSETLKKIPGISVHQPVDGVIYNNPYLIIRINEKDFGLSRDELCEQLKLYNIFTRKYFYPLCSNLQCYAGLPSANKAMLPIANKAADTVLSLPLYGDLKNEDVERICQIINEIRLNKSR